jgi:hypothetical protein
VAFATCSFIPDGWPDDAPAASLLGAEIHSWDDPQVDWQSYDRVIVRSVFDYVFRLDRFLAWCHGVGAQRLRNAPELVSFNADKRYLSELRSPTVETLFVGPDDRLPELSGEVVVKPNVSAAARDTGRFTSATHGQAIELIEHIQRSGRTALVQSYLPSVDERGETSLLFFGGKLSHVVRKRAVLRPDEIAPVAQEGLGRDLAVAQATLDSDLAAPSEASLAERRLGERAHAEISARFGTPLLLRVDIVHDNSGAPVLMELEAIEPHLYLATHPGAAEAFAAAVRAS